MNRFSIFQALSNQGGKMISEVPRAALKLVFILCLLHENQFPTEASEPTIKVSVGNHYQVVVPYISDERGDFISYDVTSGASPRRSRSRRSTHSDDGNNNTHHHHHRGKRHKFFITLNINEEKLVLKLKQAKKLLPPYAIIEEYDNDTATVRPLTSDCMYKGKVNDIPFSSVAVSLCNGLDNKLSSLD
ncbi:A disintegrin and metalloproteinase with thrombospondin motifs 14-like [Tubulanus polymorphus]|uniref:A disintegrin and metalloproteinase with thrombospondin motifs 14-like n=1 Tax=Tubulanus polymorphus TaxID=672921 RepID=UPI003DA2E058